MQIPLVANPLSVAQHYENFPVGSWLVPRDLRPALAAIYRFARYADDVADEGELPGETRLVELARLHAALEGGLSHPVVAQLLPAVARHGLARAHFHALLEAFEQDVRGERHPDFASLLDYCSRSANPVGALVLTLFGCDSASNRARSDAICTALQLINFLQDVGSDWDRGRIYLPCDELASAGFDETRLGAAVRSGCAPEALRVMIEKQSRRAAALLSTGAPLVAAVPTRLGCELRAVLAGARRVLAKLESGGFDPIARRPALRWSDAPALVWLWLSPVRGAGR